MPTPLRRGQCHSKLRHRHQNPDTCVVAFWGAKCYLYLLGFDSGLHNHIFVIPLHQAVECGSGIILGKCRIPTAVVLRDREIILRGDDEFNQEGS
jgi:hypothetical protein